jgi:hypothetical protein
MMRLDVSEGTVAVVPIRNEISLRVSPVATDSRDIFNLLPAGSTSLIAARTIESFAARTSSPAPNPLLIIVFAIGNSAIESASLALSMEFRLLLAKMTLRWSQLTPMVYGEDCPHCFFIPAPNVCDIKRDLSSFNSERFVPNREWYLPGFPYGHLYGSGFECI